MTDTLGQIHREMDDLALEKVTKAKPSLEHNEIKLGQAWGHYAITLRTYRFLEWHRVKDMRWAARVRLAGLTWPAGS